jgi:hypothetical protein
VYFFGTVTPFLERYHRAIICLTGSHRDTTILQCLFGDSKDVRGKLIQDKREEENWHSYICMFWKRQFGAKLEKIVAILWNFVLIRISVHNRSLMIPYIAPKVC